MLKKFVSMVALGVLIDGPNNPTKPVQPTFQGAWKDGVNTGMHYQPVRFEHDTGSAVRTLFEYPLGTWIENVAVRSNGELLLTVLEQPRLDMLSPLQSNATPSTVYTFPNATSVSGIAEVAPDVFAMAVGNFSFTNGPEQGSWSIWTLEFTNVTDDVDEVKVKKITDLPEAIFLNGFCSLPGSGHLNNVLTGDIRSGLVYRIDASTGEYEVAINNSLTAVVPDPVFGESGVNGLHVYEGDLYFTNTGQGIFAKVPILRNGSSKGSPEIIARVLNSSLEFDDFAIHDDDAFLVTGSGNSIERIGLDGTPKGRIVAGSLNSTVFAEPTSCAFGRTKKGRDVLYVVTAGGLATPVDGNVTVEAQVVAVDVEMLLWW